MCIGSTSAIKGVSLRWLAQKDLSNIIYGTNGSQYSQAKTETEHQRLLLNFIHGHLLNSSEFFLGFMGKVDCGVNDKHNC